MVWFGFFPWHLDFGKLNWELGNGIWSTVSLFYLQLCLRLILSYSDSDWSASRFGSPREVATVVCWERQHFKIGRYKWGDVAGPEAKISATRSFSPHSPASLRELAQFLKWSLSCFTVWVWRVLGQLERSCNTMLGQQASSATGVKEQEVRALGAWTQRTGVEIQTFTSGEAGGEKWGAWAVGPSRHVHNSR